MEGAAFFDLDKTILAKSSVLAFAGPMYEAQLLTRLGVARSASAQLSFVYSRADHALMEKMRAYLSAMVAGWEVATLRQVIARHVDKIVTPLIYAEAAELIAQHHAAGRPVVVVTSTGAEIAAPIGALLGVDHVLSTQMVERDGLYTGEIADYMYGPRKASAVIEFAQRSGFDLAASYGYSDSATDLPLLEAVGHPHAVNPDRDLRRAAVARGWSILDFQRAPVLSPPVPRHRLIMIITGSLVLGGIAAYAWTRLRTARRKMSTTRRY